MEIKVKIPKETKVEIGQRIPLTKNFKYVREDLITFVIVKKRTSDDEIIVEFENIDIKCGGIMDRFNNVFHLKELSLIHG